MGVNPAARHCFADRPGEPFGQSKIAVLGSDMISVDSHAHIWGSGFVPPAFFRAEAEAIMGGNVLRIYGLTEELARHADA